VNCSERITIQAHLLSMQTLGREQDAIASPTIFRVQPYIQTDLLFGKITTQIVVLAAHVPGISKN